MKRFKDILYVVPASMTCGPVLERVVTLAENNQATLTLVSVVEQVNATGLSKRFRAATGLQAELVSRRQQQLDGLVESYVNRLPIETKVLVGTPFMEIICEVLRYGRDLVVKSPDHVEWLDRLLGSDDMNLLRQSPCPVWLVKTTEAASYRRILAAVDFDVDAVNDDERTATVRALNHEILDLASSLALSESAGLHIVHVWEAFGESALRDGLFTRQPQAVVDDYVREVEQQHASKLGDLISEVTAEVGQDVFDYLDYTRHLVKGAARQEIPLLAKEIKADLVVMGTVARTGVPGFVMGNTAETILNQIDCSVLAIKPPGFESPVTLAEDDTGKLSV